MGIFSEAAASYEAEQLAKVLEAAIVDGSYEVLSFVDKHILPLYLDAKCEAWEKPDQDLLNRLKGS